jgi:signal transduction histidine kinase/CheY-like chemotaxis protein
LLTDVSAEVRDDAGMSERPPAQKKPIHPLRDALLAATLTFVTSAVGLSIVYVKAHNAQMQAVRSELLQLARTTAAQVDGDLIRTLVSPTQEGSPEHLRALLPLQRMHRAATDVVFVYTGVMIKGRIFWILDSKYGEPLAEGEDAPDPIMTEYFIEDAELVQAFEKHVAIADIEPVKEPTRTLLSAFAPIYDHAGQFVGILGVDMVLDKVEARMAVIRRAFEAALLAVLVLSLVAGAVALRMRRFAADIVRKMREARAEAEASAAAAQSATRAKTDFLAMMSHEIRTPMNGMLGVADLLRNMAPDTKQKKLIDILTASGSSLLRLINDILDFSKIEAERLELRPKPFEISSLLEELEHLLGAHARTKQVRLKLDAAPDLPAAVNGDRQRLSQVLLNLGTNAVKFTDRGEVTLSVRALQVVAGKARLEFTVSDTGIGMDPGSLAKLFSPFTQLADAGRHRGGGTGLGLVIAQKLVNLMGGRIRVQSELTKGSTFSFTIELPTAQVASATTTSMVLRLEVLSILVAEDNMVNQTIVDAMLRQLGHRATLVGTGREALEALASADFDLVLMDCNMPEMDGMEATRRLRKGGARDPRIPVIALTANAMDGDRERCLAAGMDDFVSKPVTISELRKAIERVRELARAAA